jgi:HK97 gp10 family phage protein
MSNSLTVDVDASALFKMLDQLGESADAYIKEAAKVTAERIAQEARGRLARQTSGTGKTQAAITVTEEEHGARVFVGRVAGRNPNVPLYLEFGTKFMSARPFLFASAMLEEGPHMKRVERALQKAIDEASR